MNIVNSTSVMVESMHLPLRGHMARSMNIINSIYKCRGRTHLPLIDYLAVNCILYTNHLIILFHAMYIYIYVYILIHIIYNNMYACTVGVNYLLITLLCKLQSSMHICMETVTL